MKPRPQCLDDFLEGNWPLSMEASSHSQLTYIIQSKLNSNEKHNVTMVTD